MRQAINDIASTPSELTQLQAIKWIDSPDYSTVCSYAEIQADKLMPEMKNLAGMSSRKMRMFYGNKLIKALPKFDMKVAIPRVSQ